MEKPKIIILGGSGFIGSNFIVKWKEKYKFTILDLKNPKIELGDVNWIEGDILNEGLLKSELMNYEGIIHLAAVSRVLHAHQEPFNCWNVNVGGTLKVINVLKELQHFPWIVYGSSREVYGESCGGSLSERVTLNPINVYGISKQISEELIQNYSLFAGANSRNLRFSNVYGKVNDHLDRVTPKFILKALRGENLSVHGTENLFDFTHIEDTIEGIKLAVDSCIESSEASHEVYNLCTGVGTSLLELARLIIKLSESNSKVEIGNPRNYDVQKFVGSYTKANKNLNFSPKIGLKEGVKGLIALFREANL